MKSRIAKAEKFIADRTDFDRNVLIVNPFDEAAKSEKIKSVPDPQRAKKQRIIYILIADPGALTGMKVKRNRQFQAIFQFIKTRPYAQEIDLRQAAILPSHNIEAGNSVREISAYGDPVSQSLVSTLDDVAPAFAWEAEFRPAATNA